MHLLQVLIGYLIICVVCDWLERLFWFWFHNAQLKTAIIEYNVFEQSNTSSGKTIITMFLFFLARILVQIYARAK